MLEGDRPNPIYIRIKPTNICNQKCYYCGYADDILFEGRCVEKREYIPWKILEYTLYDLKDIGVKALTFSGGGEPLCYPHFSEMLDLVEKLGFDYSTITNGQALKNEYACKLRNAKWVRVSFDSSEKDTYERIRGVNTYEQVVENIFNFAKIKSSTCTLGINCVVSKSNCNEIFDICKLVKDLGVENIKLSPILVKEENYHSEIKSVVEKQIERAKKELETQEFRIIDKYTSDIALSDCFEKSYSQCYIQNFFAVIAADSKVYRCHQRAYMPEGEIGDLRKKSFKEIWYSSETIENTKRYNPKAHCNFRCAFDERNMLLDDLIHLDKNHINFI